MEEGGPGSERERGGACCITFIKARCGINKVFIVLISYMTKYSFSYSCIAAHLGRDKTYDKVKARYWWPSMLSDVGKFVASCKVCQHTNSLPKNPRQPLRTVPVPLEAWQQVSSKFKFASTNV